MLRKLVINDWVYVSSGLVLEDMYRAVEQLGVQKLKMLLCPNNCL